MRVIEADGMPWLKKLPAEFVENHICSSCHAYVELKIDDVQAEWVWHGGQRFKWSWVCPQCRHRNGVDDSHGHVTAVKDAQKRVTRRGRHRKL